MVIEKILEGNLPSSIAYLDFYQEETPVEKACTKFNSKSNILDEVSSKKKKYQ